jgi:isochorismate hydrolase
MDRQYNDQKKHGQAIQRAWFSSRTLTTQYLEKNRNYLLITGFVTRIGTIRTHNQIIQAIAVDIACAGD